MNSKTAKLPKGESYPLKPTMLEAAFANAGIETDVYLIRQPGDLFDVHFWPPNRNVPFERFYIRIGSVPSKYASEARLQTNFLVVTPLIQWMSFILTQDLNSPVRREKQSRSFGGFLRFRFAE